jgi:hypothetical protein
MEAEARIVWNPYFSVTDSNGSFKLNQVPAGKYKVTAWHPYAGEHTQEILTTQGVDTNVSFEVK